MIAAILRAINEIVTWLADHWRILALMALAGAIFYAGDNYAHKSDEVRILQVQKSWDADHAHLLQQAEEVRLGLMQQAASAAESDLLELKRLEEIKNANEIVIGNLSAQLDSVRVQLPDCSGAGSMSSAAQSITAGIADTTAASGVLSAEPQAAFDRFEDQLRQDARTADEIVEQCRALQGWISR